MDTVQQIPEWFGTAALGAVVAAFGYVSKLILSWWSETISNYRKNKARLVELHSMLRATKVAFDYQKEIRGRLHAALSKRNSDLVKGGGGCERHFSNAYPSMTDDELELHSIIQAYTIYTLHPINEKILDWLKKDTYYKAKKWKLGNGHLDARLTALEGHLFLWIAKYKMWIPDQPNHALVYLADENQHGLGFPTGIEDDIEEAVNRKHWLFG
jgi:hypothetical protein